MRSGDVQRSLGAALLPEAKGVSLDEPEVTASLEIMSASAYLFEQSTAAEAGLPLGCEGRAVSLISGGFDSPVASWLMMKRGVALDYVFCNLGGRQHQIETLAVAKAGRRSLVVRHAARTCMRSTSTTSPAICRPTSPRASGRSC